MRIVIVQRRFHPNTLGWVEGLRELGHEVRLVLHTTSSPGDPVTDVPIIAAPPSPRLTGVLHRLLRTGKRRDVWVPELKVVWRELDPRRTDLVLLKQVRLTSVIVGFVALLRRVPRIGWSNRGHQFERRWQWRWLLRLGIIPRRQVWTSTDGTAALGSDHTNMSGRFIPYAVPLPPAVSLQRREASGPLRVLTVGKFDAPRKRMWWTIDGAQRAGVLDKARFTFVGTGSEVDEAVGRIRTIAAEADVEDAVTMAFDVPHAEMSGIYAAHDLLDVPSRDEPFGMVVLEAMAHGLAVVVSDTVGARSCVFPERSGLVFDSDDVDDLARKLRRLVDDPALVRKMGAHGRELAQRHAAPNACAQAILDLAASPRARGR